MTEEKMIEQLLAAFYNGDTTPEEEEVLLNYLKKGFLKTDFERDSELFHLLYDTSSIPLPEGFSQRLEKTIDQHIAQNAKPQLFHNKLYLTLMSVAAVAMLCIGLFFLIGKNDNPPLMADTYSNPAEAAEAVEQTLMLVSSKLNKGLSPLEIVKENFNTTNRLLNENFTLN